MSAVRSVGQRPARHMHPTHLSHTHRSLHVQTSSHVQPAHCTCKPHLICTTHLLYTHSCLCRRIPSRMQGALHVQRLRHMQGSHAKPSPGAGVAGHEPEVAIGRHSPPQYYYPGGPPWPDVPPACPLWRALIVRPCPSCCDRVGKTQESPMSAC